MMDRPAGIHPTLTVPNNHNPAIMSSPEVSILIPNYKTPDLTKICLRLIRKNTDANRVEVIVIDNDSRDASLDFLRSLDWIQLIERTCVAGETVGQSHARALDLGLERVTTPYVLSIHTDTLIHHPAWLDFLLQNIERSPNIAGVGSWKLETKPLLQRSFKRIEKAVQTVLFPLLGKGDGQIEGRGDNFYYLRSHCALYRTGLIRRHRLSFCQGDDTAGKMMHKALLDAGYQMVFLPPETLIRYLYHANHATMALNPELGSSRRSIRRGTRRIEKTLESIDARAILADDSLDQ
jgi:glycosyltransferase involved in cell wall biosynthesis